MRCPYCHCDDDRVIDTRAAEGGYMIRRKRTCSNCGRRFGTVEKIEQQTLRVVKRDNTREPLDREKIRRGIERACSKRPVSSERIEQLVQSIESHIYNDYETEIPAKEVGEIVMGHLSKLDEVAYIRFASVYQEFHTAKDFITEVARLTQGPVPSR
ncbi:transcriptional regulator NrdR [Rhodopirellula sp. MGV]|uniref:transcriptional regulator NrdR n=1 Tax=Rhodopirellula sp. MGV TaxID=2023130 RepID=UPI000B96FC37|nr:transcriptional regulator NrdR [Rhodopirellula sp. MGV]OYP38490.1 transcriptional regulator NrdR [Rhodopirellula sp. MGV]PNY33502.1 transcriptional repressor NrdR [Rhodopirellula baltica]